MAPQITFLPLCSPRRRCEFNLDNQAEEAHMKTAFDFPCKREKMSMRLKAQEYLALEKIPCFLVAITKAILVRVTESL